MIKVVTIEQMRAIERATDAAGVSYDEMMERAGASLADVVRRTLAGNFEERRVVALVGPGNNGGDGLVAARLLAEQTSLEVSCYLLRPRDDDPLYIAAREAGVFMVDATNDQRWRVLHNLVASADVVLDALLGIGARLPIEGNLAKLIKQAAAALDERRSIGQGQALRWPGGIDAVEGLAVTVVAVDCPSGLDCDSGELDRLAIPADITVTFAAAKPGLLRFPGAAVSGSLVIGDIGAPPSLAEWDDIALELADPADVAASLPARPADGNKGTFGRAVLVAGSLNYTGAAYLAGLAAYRVGSGLVTMAVPQPLYPALSSMLPEATWMLLPHHMGAINAAAADVFQAEIGAADALLLGPGWGRDEETGQFLLKMLQPEKQAKRGAMGFVSEGGSNASDNADYVLPPLVIDADGLNLLSEMDEWWSLLPEGTILTPHPGEMARITGLDIQAIQDDRVEVARRYAAEWNCVLVLKGAFTVVAAPDGQVVLQPFANSALAKAGTGDVLAGAIVGLLAQGMSPMQAAVAGAYLHGLAGQLAVQTVQSPRSLLASEVAEHLGGALAQIEMA